MILTLLLIILLLIIVIALIRENPDLRDRLLVALNRRAGFLRSTLGLHQPRDIQVQAILKVREAAYYEGGNRAVLSTDVEVLLNPETWKELEGLRDRMEAQISDGIYALDGTPVTKGEPVRYKVIARPEVKIKSDEDVLPKDVEISGKVVPGTQVGTEVRPILEDEEEPGEAAEPSTEKKVLITVNLKGNDQPAEEVTLPATVGRGGRCGILIDHNSISRPHCLIEWRDGHGFTITDLDSKNGVRLKANAEKFPLGEPVPFHPEQELVLSDSITVKLALIS